MRPDQKGSTSFAFFVVIFFAATIAFFFFILSQSKNKSVSHRDLSVVSGDAKLERLEKEISQLYLALDGAETMKSSSKYLEIIAKAEDKLMEADDLLEEVMKTQRGLVDGMMGGLSENYEARFSRTDKFGMLSRKYRIPAAKLRRIKADMELMFLDEFVAKYTPIEEELEEKTSGPDAADSSRGSK